MKGKQQLLHDIQDDLRWVSQTSGRSTLSRSHTTVEDQRPRRKFTKLRRSSVTLSKIKEETDHDTLITSTTLPHSMAVNNRPKMLGLHIPRSSSASAGSSLPRSVQENQFAPSSLPKKGVIAKPGLSTIESSPKRKKRSPRRYVPDSPDESPVLKRNRAPKMDEVGKKASSMEYSADDEEMMSPESKVIANSKTESPGQSGRLQVQNYAPDESSSLVISNPLKVSPFQSKKKVVSFEEALPTQDLVTVEVHCNNDVHLEEEPNTCPKSSPRSHDHKQLDLHVVGTNKSTLKVDEFETSVTSETRLLPLSDKSRGNNSSEQPAKRRRKRSKSPNISVRKKLSLSQPNVDGDERDELIDCHGDGSGSPYFAWEKRPENSGASPRAMKACSLDRKFASCIRKDDKQCLYDDSESGEG